MVSSRAEPWRWPPDRRRAHEGIDDVRVSLTLFGFIAVLRFRARGPPQHCRSPRVARRQRRATRSHVQHPSLLLLTIRAAPEAGSIWESEKWDRLSKSRD